MLQRLLPRSDGRAQLPQCLLVGIELIQRVPGEAQLREKKLVRPDIPPQIHHATGNGVDIGFRPTQASQCVNALGQRTQAVTQLAGVLVGHTFTQKTADVAKRLVCWLQSERRRRHAFDGA